MNDIYEMLKELRPEVDFENAKQFVTEGLIDSYDLVSLVSMIEEKYEIMIDPLEMVPENFETVDSILNLIKKSGGRPAMKNQV